MRSSSEMLPRFPVKLFLIFTFSPPPLLSFRQQRKLGAVPMRSFGHLALWLLSSCWSGTAQSIVPSRIEY